MGEETDLITERVIEYCKRVNQKFKLKRVILFGSRSRGDFYAKSDIDLLLISDEFPEDWFKRGSPITLIRLHDSYNGSHYTLRSFLILAVELNWTFGFFHVVM